MAVAGFQCMDNFLEEASQIFTDAGFARIQKPGGLNRWFQRSENVAPPLHMAGTAYTPLTARNMGHVAAVSLERSGEGRPIGRVYVFLHVEQLRIYLPEIVSKLEGDAASGRTTMCPKCGAWRYPVKGSRGWFIGCPNYKTCDSPNIEDGYVTVQRSGKAR